ncbi:MAG TPA: YraN family protein [Burkholderiaceae bacterium]|nr:YraN family protein [Burkholderiaceae bacterium]
MPAKPGRPTGTRTPRQRAGDAAEAAACDHLVAHGLRIVARNVRYRAGELDIVAADGPQIVFVEVRWRSGLRFGGAAGSVGAVKRRRIVRAAQLYLLEHAGRRWPPCRFDVIGFEQGRLEWFVHAFGFEEER